MTSRMFSPVRNPNSLSWKVSPRHGYVASPKSRAAFAEEAGQIGGWLHYGIEGGKFFPETVGRLRDKDAPDDVANMAPPPDGKIASGNVSSAAYLDRTDIDWFKHPVYGGEAMDFVWQFSAQHKYRRFKYFITREGWDPARPLSRAQFEAEPFAVFLNTRQPYWAYSQQEMWPAQPTTHTLTLPRREGYHVLMGIWEVAETDKAFYQVVDLQFLPDSGGPQRPETPTGFAFDGAATHSSVGLKWNASSGPYRISRYIIHRNGSALVSVDGALNRYLDEDVLPLTHYSYTLVAVDEQGNESLPSAAISITTPAEEGNDQPAPPTALHSMGTTESTISLMWSAPAGTLPLTSYIVYRDGQEVKRVPATQLTFLDENLAADTEYRYLVTALAANGQSSVPSNAHVARTQAANGDYPDWQLMASYKTGDIVRHTGRLWRCLVGHTAYAEEWAPGAVDGFTLWQAHGRAR